MDGVKTAIGELAERASKARFKARRDLEAMAKAPTSVGAVKGAENSCLEAEHAERALEAARRATDPARAVDLARVGVRVGSEAHTIAKVANTASSAMRSMLGAGQTTTHRQPSGWRVIIARCEWTG